MKSANPQFTFLEQSLQKLQNDNVSNGQDNQISNMIMLLDGGTGEELFRKGVPNDRKIWSATAVVHSQYHSKLKEVHESYFKAGSNAVTANSYGITPGVGFEGEKMLQYISIAARIAKESINNGKKIVLGSLGPLVESYRPDLILSHEEGVSIYSKMMNSMHPHINAYIAETMSSVEEAFQIVDAAMLSKLPQTPLFVSFTLSSHGNIRSKENIISGLSRFLEYENTQQINLKAILFNCSEPEAITMALRSIKNNKYLLDKLKEQKILLGAYANRLTPIEDSWSLQESEETQSMRTDINPQQYFEDFVQEWVNDLGVQIIGGCCGVTPEHIAYIHEKMRVL